MTTSDAGIPPLNRLILKTIEQMPRGGGYAANGDATRRLQTATVYDGQGLFIAPEKASPAYCSGATYLLFLSLVKQLVDESRLALSKDAAFALLIRGQHDGEGIWGRWNANGPGTARLFYELQLGRNFTRYEEAEPGDFMKIFWNDNIGSKEFGHSVVFLRTFNSPEGEPMVEFWSANKPDGFGRKSVPRSKIHRAVFSRLENPQRLAEATKLDGTDEYLADMLKRASTPEEMLKMVGVATAAPDDGLTSASANN